MKKRIVPWITALVSAIIIHVIIIELSNSQHWFDIDTSEANFKMFILPSNSSTTDSAHAEEAFSSTPSESPQDISTPESSPSDEQQSGKELSKNQGSFDPEAILNSQNQSLNAQKNPSESNLTHSDFSTGKSQLLDLSGISLSPDADKEILSKVFSPELREKIASSKKAQQDYLKGVEPETKYPITKDSDGTRYVNIKGVCWRLPEEGSNEGWAIVFDGCGNKSDLFHFELNISPSILTNELLGPDSPFNLNQPAN